MLLKGKTERIMDGSENASLGKYHGEVFLQCMSRCWHIDTKHFGGYCSVNSDIKKIITTELRL